MPPASWAQAQAMAARDASPGDQSLPAGRAVHSRGRGVGAAAAMRACGRAWMLGCEKLDGLHSGDEADDGALTTGNREVFERRDGGGVDEERGPAGNASRGRGCLDQGGEAAESLLDDLPHAHAALDGYGGVWTDAAAAGAAAGVPRRMLRRWAAVVLRALSRLRVGLERSSRLCLIWSCRSAFVACCV